MLAIGEALIAALVAALGAGFALLRKRLQLDEKKETVIGSAVASLLRDRIEEKYYYHMDEGCFPIHSRDSVADMCANYRALGGDGTVPQLLERLNALPTENLVNGRQRIDGSERR